MLHRELRLQSMDIDKARSCFLIQYLPQFFTNEGEDMLNCLKKLKIVHERNK